MKFNNANLIILFFCIVFSLKSQAEKQMEKKNDEGIKFEHTTWQEIITKAKNENKLIFIDAYTTWCGPCKMMAKKVFTDVEVGKFFNQNFINVKLDMEKEPGLSLKSKLNVTAYPTLIFIDAFENIEHKAIGALPKDEFLKFGNVVLSEDLKLSDYNRNYKKNGISDRNFLTSYLEILESAGENFKLKQVVLQYFNSLDSDKLLNRENWNLLKKYISDTNNKAFQYVLNERNKFDKLFGEKEVEEKIYYTFSRQGNQLCDKSESGVFSLNSDRKLKLESDLETYHIKERAKILAYSEISVARSLKDWATFVEKISKHIASGLIDTSVMSLYNYALPINKSTNNKELRTQASKWCDKGLATKDLNVGFKNAFVKLKADLLKGDTKL